MFKRQTRKHIIHLLPTIPENREHKVHRRRICCPSVLREGFLKKLASEPSPRTWPGRHGRFLVVKHRMA